MGNKSVKTLVAVSWLHMEQTFLRSDRDKTDTCLYVYRSDDCRRGATTKFEEHCW